MHIMRLSRPSIKITDVQLSDFHRGTTEINMNTKGLSLQRIILLQNYLTLKQSDESKFESKNCMLTDNFETISEEQSSQDVIEQQSQPQREQTVATNIKKNNIIKIMIKSELIDVTRKSTNLTNTESKSSKTFRTKSKSSNVNKSPLSSLKN